MRNPQPSSFLLSKWYLDVVTGDGGVAILYAARLRWGHHVSGRRCLVWITWGDRERRRWVWLDGAEQPDAEVTDEGLRGLASGEVLRLEAGRVVRDRRVLAAIADALPAPARRLAGPLARMHEVKRLDRSAIIGAAASEHGWALHEVVTW
jgi:hypothetical protein